MGEDFAASRGLTGDGPWVIDPRTPPATRLALLTALAARAAASDPHIAQIAASIELLAEHAASNPGELERERAALALAFVQRVLYREEGARELYESVDRTLRVGGNCHDLAPLLVAILARLAIPAAIVWMPQPEAQYNHVTVVAYVDGAWRWCEPTLLGAQLGEHPYDAVERLGDGSHLGARTSPDPHLKGAAAAAKSSGDPVAARRAFALHPHDPTQTVPVPMGDGAAVAAPVASLEPALATVAARAGARVVNTPDPAPAPLGAQLGEFGPVPLTGGEGGEADARAWVAGEFAGRHGAARVTGRALLGRNALGQMFVRWELAFADGARAAVTFQVGSDRLAGMY